MHRARCIQMPGPLRTPVMKRTSCFLAVCCWQSPPYRQSCRRRRPGSCAAPCLAPATARLCTAPRCVSQGRRNPPPSRMSAGGSPSPVPGDGAQLVAARLGFAPDTMLVAAAPARSRSVCSEAILELDPLVVTAEPAYSAASSSTIRDLDLALRPVASAQGLLPLVPGLVHCAACRRRQGGADPSPRLRRRSRHRCRHQRRWHAGQHGVACARPGICRRALPPARGGGADERAEGSLRRRRMATSPRPAAVDFRTKDRVLGEAEVRGGQLRDGSRARAGAVRRRCHEVRRVRRRAPTIAPRVPSCRRRISSSGNGMVRMTAPLGAGTRAHLHRRRATAPHGMPRARCRPAR